MSPPPKNRPQRQLALHVRQLRQCRRCPGMHPPPVSGGAVLSKIILLGQAPGDKEPLLCRPFAWTAGRALFRWFQEATGLTQEQFRARIYMAAVCRCFPGKKSRGGDRVPDKDEIARCSSWFEREIDLLRPELVIPVGLLAIHRFLSGKKLDEVIGRQFQVKYDRHWFDLIPLPHPSGASPWPRMEPGKTLLGQAMQLIARHPAVLRITDPRSAARGGVRLLAGGSSA